MKRERVVPVPPCHNSNVLVVLMLPTFTQRVVVEVLESAGPQVLVLDVSACVGMDFAGAAPAAWPAPAVNVNWAGFCGDMRTRRVIVATGAMLCCVQACEPPICVSVYSCGAKTQTVLFPLTHACVSVCECV